METLRYESWSGRKVARQVNHAIDAREFKGTPGHPWLLIAANPQLSAPELEILFGSYGIKRNCTWIRRRRWMFDPNTKHRPGPKPNADGLDPRAFELMSENLHLSIGRLRWLLGQYGIKRSKEWVRRWKLTKSTTDHPDK